MRLKYFTHIQNLLNMFVITKGLMCLDMGVFEYVFLL